MHRCLLIPELALHIIHALADERPAWHDSSYLKNSSDVARVARTCKALSPPALDVLWKTLHSLSPLVMCLPPEVWELSKTGKTISFKRDPTPADWALVEKYAHRVRSVSQPASFALPRLDDTALATLITPSNFGALFPFLQTLDYSVVSVSAPMIQLLTNVLSTEQHLGAATSLSVICPRASQREEVYDLFQAIRAKAMRLETLRIESFASTSSNPSLAVKLVQGDLQFLRKLDLSWAIHISPECLACLARMERLQEMCLYVRRDIGLDFLVNGCSFPEAKGYPTLARGRTFPALRSLKVMAHSLMQCTALMSLVTSPSLDTIVFSYDIQAPSTLIEAFFRQVQRTCSDTVRVRVPMSTPPPPPAAISLTLKHNLGQYSSAAPPFLIHPSQALAPLLALRRLRTLRLLHLGTIAIDDRFLREAARAWGAHLREFEECGIPWVGVTEACTLPGFVSATLDGIGAFVRRCPRLERLRVAFDGRCLPPHAEACPPADGDRDLAEVNAPHGHRCHKCRPPHPAHSGPPPWSSSPWPALQVLNVRNSPIDNPECVAAFLTRVAPALRVICVEGSLDVWRKWREVEDRMKLTAAL